MHERILMCPPTYFSIDYAINPWMSEETNSDLELTKKQWNNLKSTLESLGAEIVEMEPQPNLPDLVFTANAAVVYNKIAIISRFRFEERRPEEQFFADWFRNNGFIVSLLPEEICFEGAGDALFIGDTLFSGHAPRTDINSHAHIAKIFNINVLSLELVDKRFYHIDTCFCPLTDGYVIYFPGAFDEYGNKVIEANVPPEKRIAVTEEEACKFSCNAVSLGKNVVMNKTTDRLKKVLADKGFNTHEVDLSEFLKSGGSAKCLTLKV
ncbi:MAG: dimethylarginine dimethylaminohydrolase family protein [bacterium]